jgi:DNA-binding MarR family transcriptional regulator
VVERKARLKDPAVIVFLRMARIVQKAGQAHAEYLQGRRLSLAQFDVLAHVGADEGITQQELADSLLVTKGNVCQLLDRMEQAGLLVRSPEGRANRLFLTETGKDLFSDVVPAVEELIRGQFSALSSQERAHLLALLHRLDHAID